MADIPVLNPAATANTGSPQPQRRGRLVTLVLLLVLAANGAAAWFYFTNDETMRESRRTQVTPPIYVPLDPPFVVNFEAEQLVRFLQVSVELMTRDVATADLLKANDPVLRNDLLLLFANQKYQDIATREGKERLRQEALSAVRRVVAAAGGRPERVEAVYFTAFVMQ